MKSAKSNPGATTQLTSTASSTGLMRGWVTILLGLGLRWHHGVGDASGVKAESGRWGPTRVTHLFSLDEEGPPPQTNKKGPPPLRGWRAFLIEWSRGDSNP